MNRRGAVALLATASLAFVLGGLAHRSYPSLKQWLATDETSFHWPAGFAAVAIPSSVDESRQDAIFGAAGSGPPRPLLVSLHTWAGSYASRDSLAPLAARAGWNYVRPDFRGPNRGPDNCLSEKVLADIDDAIDYAVRAGNVDSRHIYVVGFSGGGHAALGTYVRTRHPVRAFLAWAPIADLGAWHDELLARGNTALARQVRACTGSGDDLDTKLARARSPLFWPLAQRPRGRIELYAGIDDGYTGTVPVSHSLRFFDRLVDHHGAATARITPDESSAILGRGLVASPAESRTGGRAVLFHRSAPFGSLTVFRGTHEMPADMCFARLTALARSESP